MQRQRARARQCAAPAHACHPTGESRPICTDCADPVCVGIPATTDDSRILTHADAAAIAYQVPDMNHPAPGSQGLPVPCALD